MNGEQFLESLRDGREIYIYGERVKRRHDASGLPQHRAHGRAALRRAARSDKHKDKLLVPTDTGNGGMTQAYFKAPKNVAESVAGRDAIAEWAKITYGWLGRAPDYKAAFLGTLGANADFYDPWQENAKRWYQFSQERVPFVNHAIIHPPIDRNRPPNEVGDVCCHVEKETDAGIIVSGAKVVATGSALTNYTFVAHHGLIPVQDKNFAAIFMIPTNAPGVKLICRTSYEMTSTAMGSPFDYPLSSRIDENDAVFILDKVLIPWENVFCYGDVEKANNFFPRTGFLPRALLHGCTRLAVKLDFIAGLLLKAVEATGSKDFRGVQANVGEVLVWRNLFWGLTEAMARNPKPWVGDYLLPDIEPAGAYQIVSTMAYTRVKHIIEQTVASGLIYLNSSARDFKNPEIRPYIDKYMRGSNGYDAEEPRQAAQASVGHDRHRIRRPARTVRDQLRRLDRGNPPLCAVRCDGGRYGEESAGLRRAMHGGIRSRRLEGAGPDRSGRTQLSRHPQRGLGVAAGRARAGGGAEAASGEDARR